MTLCQYHDSLPIASRRQKRKEVIVDVAIGIGIPFLVAGPLCELWLLYPLEMPNKHIIQTMLSKTLDLLKSKTLVVASAGSHQH